MTAPSLPSKERLEELRFHAERGDGPSVTNPELLSLLDAALTLRRLEEWLEIRGSLYVAHYGDFKVDLFGAPASRASPDLLAALQAALAAAEAAHD